MIVSCYPWIIFGRDSRLFWCPWILIWQGLTAFLILVTALRFLDTAFRFMWIHKCRTDSRFMKTVWAHLNISANFPCLGRVSSQTWHGFCVRICIVGFLKRRVFRHGFRVMSVPCPSLSRLAYFVRVHTCTSQYMNI